MPGKLCARLSWHIPVGSSPAQVKLSLQPAAEAASYECRGNKANEAGENNSPVPILPFFFLVRIIDALDFQFLIPPVLTPPDEFLPGLLRCFFGFLPGHNHFEDPARIGEWFPGI